MKQWNYLEVIKQDKDKNRETVPHLEITYMVLVHWHVLHNNYHQDWRVLCVFVPNKAFGNLLEIAPTKSF